MLLEYRDDMRGAAICAKPKYAIRRILGAERAKILNIPFQLCAKDTFMSWWVGAVSPAV